MKLLFFSDLKKPNKEDVKIELIGLTKKEQPTIGYISSSPDPFRQFYSKTKYYYSQLRINLMPYLDLESGYNNELLKKVFEADAIHLSGGNTYQFYYWIIKRGLKEKLITYANSGKLIIGVSAGAIVMTPDINCSQFCGDKNYIGLKDLEGLALVDFLFIPHCIKQKAIPQNIKLESLNHSSKVVAACDYDWISIDKAKTKVYGNPKLITKGQVTDISSL